LHVLMGADHLIALAVVAAPGAPERRKRRDVESRGGDYRAEDEDDDDDENDDERTTRFGARPGLRRALRSAMLGVQWGCGHALGLALVCAVFFATRRRMNLDDFGEYADKAVGASMIALGLVSLWSLWRWRRRRVWSGRTSRTPARWARGIQRCIQRTELIDSSGLLIGMRLFKAWTVS